MAHRSTMSIRGWVATNPVCRSTANGTQVTSFRVADTVRRRDPATGEWSDTKTTWYTARVWGEQALNVAESLRRSDPVIVTGHPWLDEWIKSDGQPASQLVLDAEVVSPDLSRGTAQFRRMNRVEQLGGSTEQGTPAPLSGFVPVPLPDDGENEGIENDNLGTIGVGGELRDALPDTTDDEHSPDRAALDSVSLEDALEEDLSVEIEDALRATA